MTVLFLRGTFYRASTRLDILAHAPDRIAPGNAQKGHCDRQNQRVYTNQSPHSLFVLQSMVVHLLDIVNACQDHFDSTTKLADEGNEAGRAAIRELTLHDRPREYSAKWRFATNTGISIGLGRE